MAAPREPRRLPVIAPDPAAPAHAALRGGIRQFVRRRVHADHVDDLVQEVFLRLSEHAGELREDGRLAPWAFRIARNVVVDHHRRTARRRADPDVLPDELAGEPVTSDDNVNEIVAGWLRPMLTLLPPEYAEALELVELEGMSQKDYAAHAGLSLSGAKSRVQRARGMLEGVVRACCDLEQDVRGNVIGYRRRADPTDER